MHPTAPRTNRIPRVIPTRPGLCRRLHRWIKGWNLRSNVRTLTTAKAALEAGIAMDHAAACAHRLQYTRSPVLQERMRREQQELLSVSLMLAEAELELANFEGGL